MPEKQKHSAARRWGRLLVLGLLLGAACVGSVLLINLLVLVLLR